MARARSKLKAKPAAKKRVSTAGLKKLAEEKKKGAQKKPSSAPIQVAKSTSKVKKTNEIVVKKSGVKKDEPAQKPVAKTISLRKSPVRAAQPAKDAAKPAAPAAVKPAPTAAAKPAATAAATPKADAAKKPDAKPEAKPAAPATGDKAAAKKPEPGKNLTSNAIPMSRATSLSLPFSVFSSLTLPHDPDVVTVNTNHSNTNCPRGSRTRMSRSEILETKTQRNRKCSAVEGLLCPLSPSRPETPLASTLTRRNFDPRRVEPRRPGDWRSWNRSRHLVPKPPPDESVKNLTKMFEWKIVEASGQASFVDGNEIGNNMAAAAARTGQSMEEVEEPITFERARSSLAKLFTPRKF